MLFDWLFTKSFQQLPRAEQEAHWLVRYNPFYWFLLFLPLYVAMAFGRACHTAIGQGPKPRAPGQDSKAFRLEHEVRMQWVYSFDGFFVAMAAIYGAILIYSAADPRGAYSARTVRRYAAAFGVCAAYAAGNVAFLCALGRRARWGVRLAVLSNFALALALAVSLVYYAAVKGGGIGAYGYASAGLFMLVQLAAGYVYGQLWGLYGADDGAGLQQENVAAPADRASDMQERKCSGSASTGWQRALYTLFFFALTAAISALFCYFPVFWEALVGAMN